MKKLSGLLCMLFIMALLVTGCGKSNETANKVKIGIVQHVEHPSLDEIRTSIIDELGVLGYNEENSEIIYKNAQGDMSAVSSIITQMIEDKVDVIIPIATPTAQIAVGATSEIPIVYSAVTDPVAAELVSTLEASGTNVTGVYTHVDVEKILDLATELTPDAKSFGLVYSLSEINSTVVIEEFKTALDKRGMTYKDATIVNSSEVQQAIQSLIGNVDAVFVPEDNIVATAMTVLAEEALNAGMPVYVAADSLVNDGALATVGVDYKEVGRKSAEMAAEILIGASAGDMPSRTTTDYIPYVNKETAERLNVDVSKYSN